MPRGAVKSRMNRLITVIVCGTALLTAVAVIFALRSRRRPLPPPDVPAVLSPAEVHVWAVKWNAAPLEQGAVAAASGTVAIVWGNGANVDRYEARNGALRSIARRRDLPPKPRSGASTKGLARSESVSAGERRGRDGSPSRSQWCAVDVASALHCGALGERALPFVALGSICWILLPVLLSDYHFLSGFCRAEIGCAA